MGAGVGRHLGAQWPSARSPFHCQDGVERGVGHFSLDLSKTCLAQQGGVFGQGALLAFRADQHVERLHQRGHRTGLVVVEEYLGDQECAAGGQTLPDFAQQGANLFL